MRVITAVKCDICFTVHHLNGELFIHQAEENYSGGLQGPWGPSTVFTGICVGMGLPIGNQ